MCNTHTTQVQDMDPNNGSAIPPGGSGDFSGSGDTRVDPNINPIAMALQKNGIDPHAVGLQKPTPFGRALELATGGAYDPTGGADTATPPTGKLTKWGALVRIISPALEGGLIGLAGGKGHPQGGFGAANDFYIRRRAMQMQNTMLARQLYNDQFKNSLELARTQHEVSVPPMTRVPNAIKGKDANGKDIYMALNPRTMQYEPIQGITPESNADYQATPTDQGIVTYDKHGAAPTKLLTLPTTPPQGVASDEEPGPDGNAPSQFDSGSSRSLGAASQSPSGVTAIPLRPAGFGKPKPAKVTNRNAAGNETDNLIDENPDSPTYGKVVKSGVATRAPLPDRTAAHTDQANDVNSQIESYAAEALNQTGNDPDKAIAFLNGLKNSDPKVQQRYMGLLPKIRQRVRERTRQGKRHISLLSPQQAEAIGATPTTGSDVNDEDDDQ